MMGQHPPLHREPADSAASPSFSTKSANSGHCVCRAPLGGLWFSEAQGRSEEDCRYPQRTNVGRPSPETPPHQYTPSHAVSRPG